MENHSRWGIKLYVANLSSYPFLIMRDAIIVVKSQDGATCNLKSLLIIFREDKDREQNKYKATSPCIIKPGEGNFIEFITSYTQSEMKAGKTIRAHFAEGSDKCKVEFRVEKIGWISKQTIISPSTLFKEM